MRLLCRLRDVLSNEVLSPGFLSHWLLSYFPDSADYRKPQKANFYHMYLLSKWHYYRILCFQPYYRMIFKYPKAIIKNEIIRQVIIFRMIIRRGSAMSGSLNEATEEKLST